METGSDRLARANLGSGCAVLLALPFAAFGLFAIWQAFSQLSGWWESRSWVELPATIQSVELRESHGGEGGTTYHVDAIYNYRFGGLAFTGDRVWVGTGSDNVGDFYQRIYIELHEHQLQNRPFRCYVDPGQPERSVLYRDLRLGLLAFEFGLAFIFGGVGFGLLVGLWIVRKRVRLAADLSDQYPDEPWRWDVSLPEGRYRPQKTWLTPVVGCCIANATGWVVAFLIYSKIPQQPWLALVFLFPIAGLMMISPAIRSIRRRLRYGAPELQVTPWPLRVGQTAWLLLETSSLVDSGRSLVVHLIVKQTIDSENTQTLSNSQAKATVNQDGIWACEMNLPDGLPRSRGILDGRETPDAKWVLEIRDPTDKWGFEAIYPLNVFDGKCASPAKRFRG